MDRLRAKRAFYFLVLAIDLPLKALAWQDAEGKVRASWWAGRGCDATIRPAPALAHSWQTPVRRPIMQLTIMPSEKKWPAREVIALGAIVGSLRGQWQRCRLQTFAALGSAHLCRGLHPMRMG